MRSSLHWLVLGGLLFLQQWTLGNEEANEETTKYGVDFSWPTQHPRLDSSRLPAYRTFIEGCYKKTSPEECDRQENDRLRLNALQPALMHNYTAAGYAKVKTPALTLEVLRQFWRQNQEAIQDEVWDPSSTYVNHWSSRIRHLDIQGPNEPYLSQQDQQQLLLAPVHSMLEAWAGTPLVPSSLYGIRIYTQGAILAPHVDRWPLVLSAIINVAQDVDEPWPLELINHEGVAVNVTMEQGDMILYESHSILHGRPYPLQGRYYANVFLHFQPVDVSLRKTSSAKELFERALEHPVVSNNEKRHRLPHFIQEGSLEADRWQQAFVFHRDPPPTTTKPRTAGVTSAHVLAARGDLAALRELAGADASVLDASDANGWRALHEAARSGRTDVVEYLIQQGVDLNERTNDGDGATPLWWAEHVLHDDHPTIRILRENGALALAPRVE